MAENGGSRAVFVLVLMKKKKLKWLGRKKMIFILCLVSSIHTCTKIIGI